MKKFKQSIAFFLVMGMMSGTLVGCSSSKQETPATSTDTKVEEKKEEAKPEEKKEEAAATEEGSKLSGEVVYWSMWNETEPVADLTKEAIKRFEAANPDVKVTVQWQGRNIKDIIIPAIQSGQKIDIFDTEIFYKNDPSIFMNLDELLASKAVGSDKTLGESILGGLTVWNKAEAAKYGLEGNYSIPYSPYVVSWFYNKDLFDQAGITEVPDTWDELAAVCQKLVDAGITPITCDDAYMNMLVGYQLDKYFTAPVVEEMCKDANHPGWKDPKFKQMVEDLGEFAAKGYFAKEMATNKYPAGQQQFALGEAAMYLNASWFPSEVKETAGPDFNWGQFAVPTVEGGAGVITDVSFGGQCYYINAKTDNKEAADELLKYFVSAETQEGYLTNGNIPCTTGTEWPAEVADQVTMVETATSNVPWAGGLAGDFADGVIVPTMVKVMTGVMSSEDGYNEIQAGLQKFVK